MSFEVATGDTIRADFNDEWVGHERMVERRMPVYEVCEVYLHTKGTYYHHPTVALG